jgi:anti-sigma B factor antagonist
MESHVLEDGIFLLKATGHLVLTHTTRIRGAIREQIDQSRTKIVLDCSAVDHMDAPSIAELVSAYSQLRRAGGDMALVRGPGLKVMEDMALGKLDPFFHDSVEEAVEHLARISPQVS